MRPYHGFFHSPGGFGFWGGWPELLWLIVPTLLMLLLLGVLLWLIGRAIFGRGRNRATVTAGTVGTVSAVEVLRQRYARGEIDGDTFQTMLSQLRASGASTGSGTPTGREGDDGGWQPQNV